MSALFYVAPLDGFTTVADALVAARHTAFVEHRPVDIIAAALVETVAPPPSLTQFWLGWQPPLGLLSSADVAVAARVQGLLVHDPDELLWSTIHMIAQRPRGSLLARLSQAMCEFMMCLLPDWEAEFGAENPDRWLFARTLACAQFDGLRSAGIVPPNFIGERLLAAAMPGGWADPAALAPAQRAAWTLGYWQLGYRVEVLQCGLAGMSVEREAVLADSLRRWMTTQPPADGLHPMPLAA